MEAVQRHEKDSADICVVLAISSLLGGGFRKSPGNFNKYELRRPSTLLTSPTGLSPTVAQKLYADRTGAFRAFRDVAFARPFCVG